MKRAIIPGKRTVLEQYAFPGKDSGRILLSHPGRCLRTPCLRRFLLVANESKQLLPEILGDFLYVVGGFGMFGSLPNDVFHGFGAENSAASGYQLAAFQNFRHGAPRLQQGQHDDDGAPEDRKHDHERNGNWMIVLVHKGPHGNTPYSEA
jgi:hypothetical protein